VPDPEQREAVSEKIKKQGDEVRFDHRIKL